MIFISCEYSKYDLCPSSLRFAKCSLSPKLKVLTGGSLSAAGGNRHHIHGISTGPMKCRTGMCRTKWAEGLGFDLVNVVALGSGLQ